MTLLLAIAAVAYVCRWFRCSVPLWRAVSFILGLLGAWIAAASPVSSMHERMLTAHMVQHLLLMTVAPPLIWLGEPVRVLWTGQPSPQAVRQAGRILGHPAFCWLAATATLTIWHVPSVFRLGMDPAWCVVQQVSFFAAGLLFWWPVVQPWPAAARWPRWSMLVYLFTATVPCDILAGLLVFSDRIAYPLYLCVPGYSSTTVLADQQRAAALMWTAVTLVFLVAGAILSTQLLRPQPHAKEALSI